MVSNVSFSFEVAEEANNWNKIELRKYILVVIERGFLC